MKTWKISGPLLFVFVAISNALESNVSLLESKIEVQFGNGFYPSISSLDENQLKFVVSYGHFKHQHYFHTCFATMISSLFGLTSIRCSITNEQMYVNVKRKPEINRNSLPKVVNSISYDEFADQYRHARENLKTLLLVFKVESSIHSMQSYDISQQTGNSANELIIGYIGRFGEPLFAARDFVTVHVYEIYKMSSLHSWYKLVTYINSLYPNVKLSLCDSGSPLFNENGVILGIVTNFEDGMVLKLQEYIGDIEIIKNHINEHSGGTSCEDNLLARLNELNINRQ